MSEFIPTPGRIVEYTLSDQDANTINARRQLAREQKDLHPGLIPAGNTVYPGETYPLVITRVWSASTGSVNGQVLLDGNDTFWATSVGPGGDKRQYRPYPRV